MQWWSVMVARHCDVTTSKGYSTKSLPLVTQPWSDIISKEFAPPHWRAESSQVMDKMQAGLSTRLVLTFSPRSISRLTLWKVRSTVPAMWKVLRVIWVEGSPTLWAAMTPTASPGAARLRMYFSSISRWNPSWESGSSRVSDPRLSDFLFFLAPTGPQHTRSRPGGWQGEQLTTWCRMASKNDENAPKMLGE